MKIECNECNGTSRGGMHGRIEDAYVCCSGHTYYCNQCEEEYDEEDLEEINEDTHLCGGCLTEDTHLCGGCLTEDD